MDINKIKKNLSIQLRRLRKENGNLTQEDVINQIGEEYISLRTYKEYESGEGDSYPSIDKLVILADFFKVSIDELMTGRSITYDGDYTWNATLKRLNRLIYCFVLIPEKNGNEYNFRTLDKEVNVYTSNLFAACGKMNYSYYKHNRKIENLLKTYDEQAALFKDEEESLEPKYKRLEYIMKTNGEKM